jgi:hypothetical protein
MVVLKYWIRQLIDHTELQVLYLQNNDIKQDVNLCKTDKIAIDPHKRTAIKGFQKGGFTAFYSRLQHTI